MTTTHHVYPVYSGRCADCGTANVHIDCTGDDRPSMDLICDVDNCYGAVTVHTTPKE